MNSKLSNNIYFILEAEDKNKLSVFDQLYQEGTYYPTHQFVSPRIYAQYDAFDNKRSHPIRIPGGLKGSRPNAEPHSRVNILC